MIKKAIIGILAIFTFLVVFATTTFAVQPKALQRPHWKQKTLTVYIAKDKRQTQMMRAFGYWKRSLFNVINFEYINKEPADIVVTFTDSAGSDTPLGSYSVTTQGDNIISKATIQISTKSKEAAKYSNNYIFTTMLHEIGHVLGLEDSIRKPAGIMNVPLTEEQDIKKIEVRKIFAINGWSFRERQ